MYNENIYLLIFNLIFMIMSWDNTPQLNMDVLLTMPNSKLALMNWWINETVLTTIST